MRNKMLTQGETTQIELVACYALLCSLPSFFDKIKNQKCCSQIVTTLAESNFFFNLSIVARKSKNKKGGLLTKKVLYG